MKHQKGQEVAGGGEGRLPWWPGFIKHSDPLPSSTLGKVVISDDLTENPIQRNSRVFQNDLQKGARND